MARISSSSFEDQNCEKGRRSGATVADQETAREAEEEDRTRLEQDLGRKAAARVVREERTEEERRVRDREERRQRDAEKSAEVASRMEEWRLEEERKVDELARAEDELKRRERREVARVARPRVAWRERRFLRLGHRADVRIGRVAEMVFVVGGCRAQVLQSSQGESSSRVFGLDSIEVLEGRNKQDVAGTIVDVIVLKSTGPTVKKWYEGFEERSIPPSFALVLSNGEPPVMFFSDTAPEKVRILFLYCICFYEYRSR
jgi:hypothetical protein